MLEELGALLEMSRRAHKQGGAILRAVKFNLRNSHLSMLILKKSHERLQTLSRFTPWYDLSQRLVRFGNKNLVQGGRPCVVLEDHSLFFFAL